MVDRSNKIALESIMPTTKDKRDEFSEGENCVNLCQRRLNDSSETSNISDVKINIKSKTMERSFKCKKEVLVKASPYFEAMFRGGFKEAYSEEITIIADPDVFFDIYNYICSQKLQINKKNVKKLMIAASMFIITDLMKLCSDFYESEMESWNWFKVKDFAEYYGYFELSTKFQTYIQRNFVKVSRTEHFKLQPESVICNLITKDELHVVCESKVFNAVLEWVKYDLNLRKRFLKKLIKNVRCHLIKPEFISSQLENCEIIRSTCSNYLTKVLKDLHAYIPIEIKPRQHDIPQKIYIICDGSLVTNEEPMMNEINNIPEMSISRNNIEMLYVDYISEAAVSNGFIYLLSSFDNQNVMKRYDPILDEWKECESLNSFVDNPILEVIQNELYAIETFEENRMMKYDPIADKWTERASICRRREFISCAVFNRMLYVVGGVSEILDTSSIVPFVDRYDPQSDRWSRCKPMLTPRCFPAVVTLGKYIYAIGGWNDEENLTSVERYDVLNDNWEFVASIRNTAAYKKAVVFNNKIYIFGGLHGLNQIKTIECYDEAANKWNEIASFSEFVRVAVVTYQKSNAVPVV